MSDPSGYKCCEFASSKPWMCTDVLIYFQNGVDTPSWEWASSRWTYEGLQRLLPRCYSWRSHLWKSVSIYSRHRLRRLSRSIANLIQHPNPEWRQRLGEIQETHFQKTQEGLPPEKRTFRVARKSMNGSRWNKSSTIPEVHTSHAQEVSPNLARYTSWSSDSLVVRNTRGDRGCTWIRPEAWKNRTAKSIGCRHEWSSSPKIPSIEILWYQLKTHW